MSSARINQLILCIMKAKKLFLDLFVLIAYVFFIVLIWISSCKLDDLEKDISLLGVYLIILGSVCMIIVLSFLYGKRIKYLADSFLKKLNHKATNFLGEEL